MMERLTEKRKSKSVIPLMMASCGIDLPYWRLEKSDLVIYISGDAADRLSDYEDTGLTPEEIKTFYKAISELSGELAKYKKAEKQGRLIVLPCKVGDTIYVPVERCKGGINVCPYEGGYGTGRCDGDKNCGAYVRERRFSIRDYPDIGKTVFLTREEAEAALKEVHNGE